MKMVRYCPYVLSRKFYLDGRRGFNGIKFSDSFADKWRWSMMGYKTTGFSWYMLRGVDYADG